MFSWSQTSTAKRQVASQYPGRRTANSHHATATVVEGSIRPPMTRAQHLESYLEDATLSRSTRRVSADDTTYDTVFQTTKGDTLIIRVHMPLSSSFASSCPAMSLAGVQAKHPWVDASSMRITGYDAIQSESQWKRSGLSLGQAVHAVVQHLQLHPPEIIDITDAGLRAIQPKQSRFRTAASKSTRNNYHSNTNGHSSSPSPPPVGGPPSYNATLEHAKRARQLPPPPEVPLPSIPRDFEDLLSEQTYEELEDILKDELAFLTLVHNLDVFQKIQKIADSKTEETKALAEEILCKQDKLQSLQKEVEELQTVFRQKLQTFRTLEAKQDAICAPPDVRTTLRRLKEAKKQAFDTSEAFAEEWVEDGAGDPDQFVKNFVAQRKIHHARAAKMEVLERPSASSL